MLANAQFLTFHGIGDPVTPVTDAETRYFVSEETYRKTISLLDALETQYHATLPVTFDDGNLSDYTVGLPALIDAKRTGKFFVLAGRIGTAGYLSAAQMQEIVAAGSSIGCHGHDHVDWRTLDAVGRQREFEDARKIIEDAAGVPVTEAAVPFGAFDTLVLQDLKKAGYQRVYTSNPGLANTGSWLCPRWSATDQFDPERDIPPRLQMSQKLKGSLYAVLRRLKYHI